MTFPGVDLLSSWLDNVLGFGNVPLNNSGMSFVLFLTESRQVGERKQFISVLIKEPIILIIFCSINNRKMLLTSFLIYNLRIDKKAETCLLSLDKKQVCFGIFSIIASVIVSLHGTHQWSILQQVILKKHTQFYGLHIA